MTNGNPASRVSGTAILAAVVGLICIAAGTVVALAIAGKLDSSSTPLVVTILGFIGLSIPSLVALLKVDNVQRVTQSTQNDLQNGLIPRKLHEAVENGVANGTLRIQRDRRDVRTRATDPPNSRTDLTGKDNDNG